jgi:hypothetical protein
MRTVGICWIAYGVFRLAVAVAAILFAPTATVMFGALLGRVADPYTLMAIFHLLYACGAALSALCGILGLLGGFSLLRGGARGRRTIVLASLLSLSDLPLGIALGVYSLILFVPPAPAREDSRSA